MESKVSGQDTRYSAHDSRRDSSARQIIGLRIGDIVRDEVHKEHIKSLLRACAV